MMFCLIIILLSLIALCDFRHRRIPNHLIFIFLMISQIYLKALHLNTALIWGIGFIFLKLILEKILKRSALGWGDIKLVMVMGLWMPLEVTPSFLLSIGLLGTGFGLIYKFFWQKDIFPFAPALILGFLWNVKKAAI